MSDISICVVALATSLGAITTAFVAHIKASEANLIARRLDEK